MDQENVEEIAEYAATATVERCSSFWTWAFTCAIQTKDLGLKKR
jgi:hypothetical protein